MYIALCGLIADTVLIREMSLVHSVRNREVPLYAIV